jgi:hypothetical protein
MSFSIRIVDPQSSAARVGVDVLATGKIRLGVGDNFCVDLSDEGAQSVQAALVAALEVLRARSKP